ncbi:CYTH and CHAD domain-containing protein [Streptomyces hygroscopicus]|uniref:CYTH and CHAD domain-containing protein n=1 Tax=Streptomyces hygroscopicus TaxID=1912 RepID=UPI0008251D29|nr:CYTH and CHAD domain-containing protein [Streptomyces hygroscopicus]MBW8089477.1 CYTH and CHAD domain-containing protein [Streptomyces hygroscopicus subsp. hygroscopicus]
MVDVTREIERKYEATDGGGLPDLAGVAGVAGVTDQGVVTLDATYYDTPGRRLAADGITLRRRTGGDEGWHLKLPVGPDARDEIRAPLSDALPAGLAGLVRSRTRGAELSPLVHLLSERTVRRLVDADGALLAVLSADRVTARRLAPEPGEPVRWTEVEVELAPGGDPALLDALEPRLTDAGLRRSATPSKLARALAETDPDRRGEGATGAERATGAGKPTETEKPAKAAKAEKAGKAAKPGKSAKAGKAAKAGRDKRDKRGKRVKPKKATAGDIVLDYARRQAAEIVALDPAVRLETPDSVHRMRVATRRLRSAFRSYREVLDRAVTDPVGDELKWLAAELGVDRDHEVLTARLGERLGEVPVELRLGPVAARLRIWSQARRGGSRERVLGVLDGERYLALLNALDALVAGPPLRPAAARPWAEVIPRAVLRDYDRLSGRVEAALATPAGPGRDALLHEARKDAKRARYAAEVARPAVGEPAKAFAGLMTRVQDLLGDHQDSVVARKALRELAVQAHGAGESAFTFGLLLGREEARAAARERELPGLWAEVSREEHRAALGA